MKKTETLEIKNEKMIPLKGKILPFDKMVRVLKRPYESISKEVYSEIINMKTKVNYFYYKNKVVTFGTHDGGYRLIPLNEEKSKEILDYNKKLKEAKIAKDLLKNPKKQLTFDESLSL